LILQGFIQDFYKIGLFFSYFLREMSGCVDFFYRLCLNWDISLRCSEIL